MRVSNFDSTLGDSSAHIPFISISNGKERMPILVRKPDTLRELIGVACKKFKIPRDDEKRMIAYIPASHFGLAEDTIIEDDVYQHVLEHLSRLVICVDENAALDDEDDVPLPAARPQQVPSPALELSRKPPHQETKPTTSSFRNEKALSPVLSERDEDLISSPLPALTPEPEPLSPQPDPHASDLEDEAEDARSSSRLSFVPQPPQASPAKRKGKLVLTEDEDSDIEEVPPPHKAFAVSNPKREEGNKVLGLGGVKKPTSVSSTTSAWKEKDAVRESPKVKTSRLSRLTSPADPTEKRSTPKEDALSSATIQPTIKTEKSTTSELPRRTPPTSSKDKDRDEGESFLVTIAHPASSKEVRCKVRGRNTIKKVVDGACKGLKLDSHRTQLYLNVTYQDEHDEAVTERYMCPKEETVSRAGIQEGSRLELVDERENEDSD